MAWTIRGSGAPSAKADDGLASSPQKPRRRPTVLRPHEKQLVTQNTSPPNLAMPDGSLNATWTRQYRGSTCAQGRSFKGIDVGQQLKRATKNSRNPYLVKIGGLWADWVAKKAADALRGPTHSTDFVPLLSVFAAQQLPGARHQESCEDNLHGIRQEERVEAPGQDRLVPSENGTKP